MSFRPPPPANTGNWTTRDWAEWLGSLGVMTSVDPTDRPSCDRCRRPMGEDTNGTIWGRCWACNHTYRGTARAVVPISYSTSSGLTSLIAQAKDDPDRSWIRLGMASVMFNFIATHATCLERFAFGKFDYGTVVPSHPSRREGRDHLKALHRSIRGDWGVAEEWDLDLLTKLKPSVADERRQHVDPGLFQASPARNLAGRRVLLLDDLYTSGSTTAAAARALMAAGADPPVVVTLGRHIARDETSVQFARDNQLSTRGFDPGTCALHGRRPGTSPV